MTQAGGDIGASSSSYGKPPAHTLITARALIAIPTLISTHTLTDGKTPTLTKA